jgi:hypothetical protein
MQMELLQIFPLTEDQKWKMVDKAELAYGQFLTALGCRLGK